MENVLMSENTNVKLASRKDLHIARKIWHVLGVAFILWLYSTLPLKVSLGLCSAAAAFVITCDYLRMRFAFFQKIVLFFMRPFMREEEKKHFTGLSYMLAGFWILFLFCSEEVVTLSLLFVMLGDPIASWFGSKYGRDKIGDKSLQGFMACFAICFLISVGFLYYTNFSADRLLYVALFAGLIGGVAELIQIPKVDDNFSMPVISGILLSLLFYLSV